MTLITSLYKIRNDDMSTHNSPQYDCLVPINRLNYLCHANSQKVHLSKLHSSTSENRIVVNNYVFGLAWLGVRCDVCACCVLARFSMCLAVVLAFNSNVYLRESVKHELFNKKIVHDIHLQ